MDIQSLKNFVFVNNLEERSIKSFWNYFNNFRKEHEEEFKATFPDFNESDLKLSVDSVALRITNWPEEGYNHVVITVELHYKDMYAGRYSIVFSLTGEVEDDHLALF
ncbi:hypothetical protein GE107_08215 [Cohnella sp. CFH 77786]|uniref:hypothetical protein n=1 Tax=Cohnella sp. CFH 77786 TaxID=2662265 RepID=UPI001C60EFCC|nr:hypothetical protein [Cohnella sp. CFH 77786]MBW5446044.1 hypothetical protein [Cohnella sp. CFH 77786]